MRSRPQLIFATLLIVLGVVSLLSNLFDIDLSGLCFPTFLLLIGLWMLLRPVLIRPGSNVDVQLLGDIDRRGSWQVSNGEYWLGVGDLNLDLTQADLPPGETTLRVNAFVVDFKLRIPAGMPFSLRSSAFITDAEIDGEKETSVFMPYTSETPGFTAAEHRLRIEIYAFVIDLNVFNAAAAPSPLPQGNF